MLPVTANEHTVGNILPRSTFSTQLHLPYVIIPPCKGIYMSFLPDSDCIMLVDGICNVKLQACLVSCAQACLKLGNRPWQLIVLWPSISAA